MFAGMLQTLRRAAGCCCRATRRGSSTSVPADRRARALYTPQMLRAAFPAHESSSLREHDDVLAEGHQHAGMSRWPTAVVQTAMNRSASPDRRGDACSATGSPAPALARLFRRWFRDGEAADRRWPPHLTRQSARPGRCLEQRHGWLALRQRGSPAGADLTHRRRSTRAWSGWTAAHELLSSRWLAEMADGCARRPARARGPERLAARAVEYDPPRPPLAGTARGADHRELALLEVLLATAPRAVQAAVVRGLYAWITDREQRIEVYVHHLGARSDPAIVVRCAVGYALALPSSRRRRDAAAAAAGNALAARR